MRDATGDASVGRLLEGYLRELQAGSPPDREAFLARHPELADVLAPALDGLEFVHGAALSLNGDGDIGTGEVLGDFRLLREIGRGGMAVVYEAEQISLGRRVALKVLPFAAVLDPRQRQRFKNEALAAAQLRHPHIVPVYAVGSERGVHYYAMQHIEGGSLATAVREMKGGRAAGALPSPLSSHASNRDLAYIRMIATLGSQAAEALDHAHQLGIVHRDVKPGNLLVDEEGTLWVADFGLARSLKDVGLTMSGELVGTVRYMSPEQALGQHAPVDHRTDVYSLGATLYELLTLEPAFPGDDFRALIQDIASKEPVAPRRLNSAVPVDLETVVLKAMAKDPAARYATAQELADDLRRFLDDTPVLARRPSLAKRVGRWARRHRGGVAAAVTILVVGAVALAVGAMREERNTRAALGKASAALAKAETNLDLAYRAVNEFLTQVGTGKFEDQPTCTPEVRALFDHALGFYDVYLAERSDPYGHIDKSYILAALGRHDEALAAADRAIKINPYLVLAHFARGTALRLLNKQEDALGALKTARDLDPNRAETHLQLGVVLKELGKFEEAVQEWNRALELEPRLPKALNNRGMAFELLGKHDKALPDFQRAVDFAPNFAVAHLNMSISLAQLARFPEALVAVDRAIALLPDSASAHMNRGAVLTALGRDDEAFAAVEMALKYEPNLGRAHYNKSVYLNARGRREEALRELLRSIELEEDYAPAHGNLGLWLFEKGEFDKALREFDRAIEIDRNFASGYGGRGQTLAQLGNLEGALEAYTKCVEVDKTYLPALVNRAGILNRLQRHAEALEAIADAIAVNKDVPMAYMFQCISLYWLKRYPEAIDSINKAIHLAPKDGENFQKRGACYEAQGKGKEALRDYDEAIDLGYLTPDLLNQVAWLHAVSPDPEVRNVKRAVKLAEEGVRLAQNNAQLVNTLGVAYCRDGQWQKAIDTLKKSMELADGGTPFDWFFAAIASWKLDQREDARSFYDRAVQAMEDENKQEDEELKRFRAEAAEVLGLTESRTSTVQK